MVVVCADAVVGPVVVSSSAKRVLFGDVDRWLILAVNVVLGVVDRAGEALCIGMLGYPIGSVVMELLQPEDGNCSCCCCCCRCSEDCGRVPENFVCCNYFSKSGARKVRS